MALLWFPAAPNEAGAHPRLHDRLPKLEFAENTRIHGTTMHNEPASPIDIHRPRHRAETGQPCQDYPARLARTLRYSAPHDQHQRPQPLYEAPEQGPLNRATNAPPHRSALQQPMPPHDGHALSCRALLADKAHRTRACDHERQTNATESLMFPSWPDRHE